MAIFATQSAIRFSTMPVDILVTRPIPNGAVLIYDSKRGAFVARGNKTSPPYIEGFDVAGSGTGASIIKEKSGSQLIFRELLAGPGILLDETSDSITIKADPGGNFLVSDTDFSVVIDSDGNDPNSVFEVLTNTGGSPFSFVGDEQEITDLELIPQNDTGSARGYYEVTGSSSTDDFSSAGFVPGLFITVEGTDEQDGEFIVDDVVASGPIAGNSSIFVTSLFSNTTDIGGLNTGVDIKSWDFRVPDPISTLPPRYDATQPYILEASVTDFGPMGQDLLPGMQFIIENADNTLFHSYGPYTITQVTSQSSGPGNYSTIQVEPNTPFPSSEIITGTNVTIKVQEFTESTGFTVDVNGNVTANDITGNHLNVQSATVDDLIVTTSGSLTVHSNAVFSQDLDVTGHLTADTGAFASGATSGAQPVNAEDLTRKDWVEDNHVRVVDPGGANSPILPTPAGAAQLPAGPTSERPQNPQVGMIRFNTATDSGDPATVGLEVFCGYDVGGNPVWGRIPFASELS